MHLFNKMAGKTQGLGFEPAEIILPFPDHASHPVFQETLLIKSQPGCLHREAGKQPKSNVVATALLQGRKTRKREGSHEKEHRSFI